MSISLCDIHEHVTMADVTFQEWLFAVSLFLIVIAYITYSIYMLVREIHSLMTYKPKKEKVDVKV